jgi:hypothetical protein
MVVFFACSVVKIYHPRMPSLGGSCVNSICVICASVAKPLYADCAVFFACVTLRSLRLQTQIYFNHRCADFADILRVTPCPPWFSFRAQRLQIQIHFNHRCADFADILRVTPCPPWFSFRAQRLTNTNETSSAHIKQKSRSFNRPFNI